MSVLSFPKKPEPPRALLSERLRGEAELIARGGVSFQAHLPPLLNEAADALARLGK